MKIKNLTPELEEIHQKVLESVKKNNLDYYPTVFQVCDNEAINMLAARGGFPERYPHWQFGMDYNEMTQNSRYGWGKIYELVINNNPCYAYLLSSNSNMDQKLVMAHVYGHNDFFKNNYCFSNTNRNMINVMASHKTKIKRYINKYGYSRVEEFIDQVRSLENLISTKDMFENLETERNREARNKELEKLAKEDLEKANEKIDSSLSKFLKSQKKTEKEKKEEVDTLNILQKPERDVLKFLAESAPIEEWQSDVISMLRDEAYYFLPQRMTKIMNEGWASFWHSKMMTEDLLNDSEIIDFAQVHSGVMYMSQQRMNPYKIGIELFKDIKERWDKGRFGLDYILCDDMDKKDNWDTKEMKGMEKIFEVRKYYNDITFIDEFFTEDFCKRSKLFLYHKDPRTGKNTIKSKDFKEIKNAILNSLTNFGSPIIEAVDSNYKNKNELLLEHIHHGVDLDLNYAEQTMQNLYFIWKRPVHIKTKKEDKEVILSFSKKGFEERMF